MDAKIKKGLFRIRPVYVRHSALPPCQVIDAIQEALATGGNVTGKTRGNHALLKMTGDKKKLWSPEFNVHVLKKKKGSEVKGVLGPATGIWTLFMIANILAILLFFLGIFLLIYQWLFDLKQSVVWSMPASLVIALLVVVVAKAGQYKGKRQMADLWQFVENSIRIKENKWDKMTGEDEPAATAV